MQLRRRRRRTFPRTLLLVAALFVPWGGPTHAAAADPNARSVAQAKSATDRFDRLWGYTNLYDDPKGAVLEKLDLRGRLQVDLPVFNSDQGSYTELQVRRFRFGFKSEWRADLTLHLEVDLDLSCERDEVCDDDAYEGLTDAYVAWSPSKAFALKLGKQSAAFTLDGATSSTRLITLERNNVTNNLWFPVEYHTGVSASGQARSWRYLAGVFSSSTTEEFGSLDGGYFGLLTLAHDFSGRLGVPECALTLDYVYNQPDPDNVSTRDLEHVASLHLRFDSGSWGLRSDLSGGIGYGDQSDLVGLALVPFAHLTETVQLVGRYTFVESFGENGVRLARYENRIDSGRGDRYHELYLGLNWFLYGHKLKLQTGLKYTWMHDEADDGGEYRGWGWTTGLRISW
jgi:phosphate-selective porin OprO/OprP